MYIWMLMVINTTFSRDFKALIPICYRRPSVGLGPTTAWWLWAGEANSKTGTDIGHILPHSSCWVRYTCDSCGTWVAIVATTELYSCTNMVLVPDLAQSRKTIQHDRERDNIPIFCITSSGDNNSDSWSYSKKKKQQENKKEVGQSQKVACCVTYLNQHSSLSFSP